MRRRLLTILSLSGWLISCEGYLGDPEKRDTPQETSCAPEHGETPPARLLTRREYHRTVRDLLGETEDPTTNFPPEPEVDGFDNNALSHVANPLLVEQLTQAAQELALRAGERGLDQLVPCDSPGQDCAETFIDDFGLRAFRRPLSETERKIFLRLYVNTASSVNHEEALVAVVEAFLQSPQFLYRIETIPGTDEEGMVPLGGYELASRLSYFLWGTMPDKKLLSAATNGSLATLAGVKQQVQRMLDDPRAQQQVRDFHAAWLDLDEFDGLVREDAPAESIESLRQSLLSFVDGVFWDADGTVNRLMSSPRVFVDSQIASLYGLPVPEQMTSYELPESRTGLLTQPGLLTLLAHTDQSSPIRRGVFVREKLLCAPVPAPPPDVDNSPPDPDPELTTRERFKVHTESASCAGCHELIDPVGFTFEEFDELGRQRSSERGLSIDTSGALIEGPDPNLEGQLENVQELSTKLAESPAVTRCLARKWFTFAMGRPDGHEDQCDIDHVTEEVIQAGGSLREILVALATSQAFRFRPAGKETSL